MAIDFILWASTLFICFKENIPFMVFWNEYYESRLVEKYSA